VPLLLRRCPRCRQRRFQSCALLPACLLSLPHPPPPLPPLQGLTSRKRRDLLRKTWVPSAGGGLAGLESRIGVRIRFFVGYSQQKGDAVERELAAEMREHGDMERLEVVDEYNELSRKTARLFSQMSSSVHADFYFKIDDDVGGCTAAALPFCVLSTLFVFLCTPTSTSRSTLMLVGVPLYCSCYVLPLCSAAAGIGRTAV
jgi:hypothetical protein